MPKKKNPQPNETVDTRALLNEALSATEDAMATLRHQRGEALRQLVRDPGGASAQIRKLDNKIADLSRDMNAINEALEVAEADARIAARATQATLAAADLATVDRLGKERIDLAAAIDHALENTLTAIVNYIDNGRESADFCRRAISNLHRNDTLRIQDTCSINLNLASGNGADAAVAMKVAIQRMLAAFNSPHIAQFIQINSFSPKTPATFTEAARMDTKTLTLRLGNLN